MMEEEMVSTFISTMKPPYYDHLLTQTKSSFTAIVQYGGNIDEGIKSGRMIDYTTFRSVMDTHGGGNSAPKKGYTSNKKKESDASATTAATYEQVA